MLACDPQFVLYSASALGFAANPWRFRSESWFAVSRAHRRHANPRQNFLAASGDVDVATFLALPPDVRQELVREWRRAHGKQAQTAAAKRTRRISSFFSKKKQRA